MSILLRQGIILLLGLGIAVPAAEVNEEQAQAFAAIFSEAYLTGDSDLFASVFDQDALLQRVTAESADVAPEFRAGFSEGFLDSLDGGRQLFERFRQEAESYDFLHVRRRDGQTYALFRFLNHDGSINYHDYLLSVEGPDGPAVAIDLYMVSDGEVISDAMARLYRLAAEQNQATTHQRLTGHQASLAQHADTILAMTQAANSGRPEQALALYRELPEDLANAKFLLLIYFQIAGHLDDAVYLDALERIEEHHGHEPWATLVLFDAYLMRGQYEKAHAAVEAIDEFVDDPYLDVLRANIEIEAGDTDAALGRAEALWEEHGFVDALWTAATVELSLEDHAAVKARLLQIERNFPDSVLIDLTGIPDYAGFVASDHYASWQQEMRKLRSARAP